MNDLIGLVQANAPVLVAMGLGFWAVVKALHKIDTRLTRVETVLELKKAKGG